MPKTKYRTLAVGELHPDVIAWRKWFESEEGKNCMKEGAYGQYLENRLWMAFMAGRREKESA